MTESVSMLRHLITAGGSAATFSFSAYLESHRVAWIRHFNSYRLSRGWIDLPGLIWGRDPLDRPSVDCDIVLGIIAAVGTEGHP